MIQSRAPDSEARAGQTRPRRRVLQMLLQLLAFGLQSQLHRVIDRL